MGQPRHVIVISGRRQRPHELMLLVWSAWVGVAYLAGAPRTASSAVIPIWLFDTWAAAMVVTGVVAVVGCWWRGDARTGLGIERGGLTAHAGALVLYAAMLFAYAGARAFAVGGIIALLVGADLWRCGQITADLRRIDHHADGDST